MPTWYPGDWVMGVSGEEGREEGREREAGGSSEIRGSSAAEKAEKRAGWMDGEKKETKPGEKEIKGRVG